MYSQLVSWSRFVFLGGVVLVVLFAIPVTWFPLALGKVALFSVTLAVCALLYALGGGMRDLHQAHGMRLALLVFLLPLSYALSWYFSADRSVGLLGYSLETDTLFFVTLAALTFFFSFALFRTLRTTSLFMRAVLFAAALSALWQCLVIFLGPSLPFAAAPDHSVNLIGKWNDFGILAVLLGTIILTRLECAPLPRTSASILSVCGVAILLLLALVNFPLAWILLLCAAILTGIVRVLHRAPAGEGEHRSRPGWLPLHSLAVVAVALIFLLFGSALNLSLTKLIPVSSLEVRPAFSSTMAIWQVQRSATHVVIGNGPNTFVELWLHNKPAGVNQTPFWNLDFNVGYSTAATALLSAGILGALLWLLPLFLVLFALGRALRLGVLSSPERLAAMSLGLASLLLMADLLFYVPSQNIILLCFAVCGACFGFLYRQGRSTQGEAVPSRMRGGLLYLGAVLLVVLCVGVGLLGVRRLAAESYISGGLSALSGNQPDAALAAATRAQQIESTQDGLRLLVDAGRAKLAAIAASTTLGQAAAQTLFTATAQKTLEAAQASILAARQDYRPYFALGAFYDLLSSLKVQGAYANAEQSYVAAAALNPQSPAIALAQARLEAVNGNLKGTQDSLRRALTLKPDYTDAILFLVQLDVSQNDLAGAVRDAKVAVQSAPGVPSVWFELGLLLYAQGNTKDAAAALGQALVLAPEYANAKYFLGLSLAAQGDTADALKFFEDLRASNPGNAQVEKIITNLRAGTAPLDGLTSPLAPRQTAPVGQ